MTNPLDLRQAFGHFGTGVAIIGFYNRENRPVGLTINSFASVSLEPALLSWCLANESQLYDDVEAVSRFSVNILAADQIDLSNRMAGSGSHVFEAGEIEATNDSAPAIKGALAHFDCHVHNKVEAGDHLMLIGGIDGVRHCTEQRAPLIYFRGAYTALAENA
ncbi:MAG: flavin reductase family protein [Alphaproteobacteria bacterium]|nr:flavin reductase family protein [Alphaproteobacteria bacterium]